MSWPVCLKQPRQQSASVCCFCVRKRVNMPTFTSSLVWILSLLPPTGQLFYVCLLLPRPSWLTHTQGGQRGESTGVSGEEDEWVSHTSEKWERHIKFSTRHPCSEGFRAECSTVSQDRLTVLWCFDNCGFVSVIKGKFQRFLSDEHFSHPHKCLKPNVFKPMNKLKRFKVRDRMIIWRFMRHFCCPVYL